MSRRTTRRAWIAALALALTFAAAAGASAKTLRWASRGDALSMDPDAANELVTTNVIELIYESLVRRDREQKLVPALASGWTVVDPKTWRLQLRRGVRFSDGTPLVADDVVFSIERAQQPTSQIAQYARRLGKPVAIDDATVELRLLSPNPILLEHLSTVLVMSRAWCIAHNAGQVPDFKAGAEGYSTRHAMGTGMFVLKTREPGIRTEVVRNPISWDKPDDDISEVVFLPIGNDATRVSALMAGDVDLIQDAPSQDIARMAANPGVRLSKGPENRVVFFGFDQFRDELASSSIKGRNPFKDVRVREAIFRAIDVDVLKSKIMHGESAPTACMTPAAISCFAHELDTHPPADLERAKRLLTDAGYQQGFDVTLDCPNDRYINDESLCVAVAGMLARIGIRITVATKPKALYFPKLESHDTSFYMEGWGGGVTDAQLVMDPILHSFDATSQKGSENNGRYADPTLDRLIDAAAVEMDPAKRTQTIADVLRLTFDQFYYVPIHRQMLTWASRANVHPIVTPDNLVRVQWIRID
jgi:peptide/nickel transport system substrate-binding protein